MRISCLPKQFGSPDSGSQRFRPTVNHSACHSLRRAPKQPNSSYHTATAAQRPTGSAPLWRVCEEIPDLFFDSICVIV
jgi:hypothetical protein